MNVQSTYGQDWVSSLIKSTDYTPDTQQLLVTFNNGQQYLYTEVTEEEYQNFCKAESKGSFFSKNFRTKKFTKLEAETKPITDGNPES